MLKKLIFKYPSNCIVKKEKNICVDKRYLDISRKYVRIYFWNIKKWVRIYFSLPMKKIYIFKIKKELMENVFDTRIWYIAKRWYLISDQDQCLRTSIRIQVKQNEQTARYIYILKVRSNEKTRKALLLHVSSVMESTIYNYTRTVSKIFKGVTQLGHHQIIDLIIFICLLTNTRSSFSPFISMRRRFFKSLLLTNYTQTKTFSKSTLIIDFPSPVALIGSLSGSISRRKKYSNILSLPPALMLKWTPPTIIIIMINFIHLCLFYLQ